MLEGSLVPSSLFEFPPVRGKKKEPGIIILTAHVLDLHPSAQDSGLLNALGMYVPKAKISREL